MRVYSLVKPTEYRRGKTGSTSPFKRTLCLPHKKKSQKRWMCLIFLLLSGFCFSRGLYCSAFPRSLLQITSLTNILTFPIKHNTSTSRSFRFSSQQGCLQVCGSSCASAWQIGWDSIPGRWYTGKERLHCGFGDV